MRLAARTIPQASRKAGAPSEGAAGVSSGSSGFMLKSPIRIAEVALGVNL